MPAVPYLPEDVAEPAELVAAIRERRGGKLSVLDRMMLHSPIIAEGWGAFMGPIRAKLGLDPFLREIAMTTPSAINGAALEVRAHGKLLMDLGATQPQVDALAKAGTAEFPKALFSDDQNAIAQLAGEITRNAKPTDETLAAARKAVGSDQGLVEIVMVISAYNMVARFVVALDID